MTVSEAQPEDWRWRTSALAVVALVLGLLSLLIPGLSIAAVACGAVALLRVRDPNRRQTGFGMAVAGIVLGVIGLFTSAYFLRQCINVYQSGSTFPTVTAMTPATTRTMCQTNMMMIGQALDVYAETNNELYPPDLGTAASNTWLTPSEFLCVQVGKPPPTLSPNNLSQWVNQNTDYIYLGAGKSRDTMDSSREVLLYEPAANHGDDGMNILFADGTVEFVLIDKARALLKEQGVELPEEQP